MRLTRLILEQLEREAPLTRRALERVPEGKDDWTPHPKSMPLGRLAHLVATMPTWMSFIVKKGELDIRPTEGASAAARKNVSVAELLKAHDMATEEAREAVSGVDDDYIHSTWKLLEGGKVVSEAPRYQFLQDNFTHLAHHRAQLTVYLRLLDMPVPAIYGPSADDHRF